MEEDTALLHMFTIESGVYTISESHIRKWSSHNGYLVWEAAYPNQIIKLVCQIIIVVTTRRRLLTMLFVPVKVNTPPKFVTD